MANPIKVKRSSTASAVPGSLLAGELAINTADKRLYLGDGTSVLPLTLDGSQISTGAVDASRLVGPSAYYVADVLHFGDGSTMAPSLTRYLPSVGASVSTSEPGCEILIVRDGVLRDFRAEAWSNGITAGVTVNVRKNGSTAVTLSLTSGVTEATDLATPLTVSAGDKISVQVVTGAGGTTVGGISLHCVHCVRPDHLTKQISDVWTYASTATYNAGATKYLLGCGLGDVANSNHRRVVGKSGSIRGIRVGCTSNTCTKDISFEVYVNGSASGMIATLLAGTTTAVIADLTKEVAVSQGDTIALVMTVPSSPGGTLSQPLVSLEHVVTRSTSYLVECKRFGPHNTQLSAGTTYYLSEWGTATTVSTRRIYVTRAGTLKNLVACTQSTSLSGNCVVTVYKNGSSTALTVTISSGTTTAQVDSTHSVDVVAGDYIEIQVACAAGTGSAFFSAGIDLLYPNNIDSIPFPCGGLIPGGRLTLSSTDPNPYNVGSGSTLYYLPYTSNRVALHNGVGWREFELPSTGVSLALSGLTAAKVYDVFLHSELGTLTLSLGTAWSSATARAEALETTDGVYHKTGDRRKRWLGILYAAGSSTVYDSPENRHLCNFYNAVQKILYHQVSGTWTSTNSSWVKWNSVDHTVTFVTIPGRLVYLTAKILVYATSSGVWPHVGIALDGSGSGADVIHHTWTGSGGINTGSVQLPETMIHSWEGYHYAHGYNRTQAGTATYGVDTSSGYESAGYLGGWVWG